MSMAKSSVVSFYLEDLSIKVFDHHSSELKQVVDGLSGIYSLYKDDRLYYVGQAKNLFRRVNQHRRDKHKRKWNRFSVYVTKQSKQISELEALTLRIVSPKGNKQKGRLASSTNLKRDFIAAMKETARMHEAEMLGGAIAKRKRKRAAKGAKGSDALSKLAGKSMKLWRQYKGVDYEARVLKSGKISMGGVKYNSPSAAASEITGRSTNGWHWWRYKTKRGDWARLQDLK